MKLKNSLLTLKVILTALVLAGVLSAVAESAPLKVAVYADKGPGGAGAAEWHRIVDDSPDMDLTLVSGADVRSGALAGQDLLIMPGGSSKDEFKSLGPDGVEKMKDFVRAGGGYIGTCAGCCLLMDAKNRARMMPWNTAGSEWALFFPNVKLNDEGAQALGLPAKRYPIRYHGGPFLWPTTNSIADASFRVWGTLDCEATYSGRVDRVKKRMYGAGAILGGTYGRGRVFVTSLHPEYFESTYPFVRGAFRYVTGRDVRISTRPRQRGDLMVGYIAPKPFTVAAARTALELGKLPGVHLWRITGDDVFVGALDHLDVLVAPGGYGAKDPAGRASSFLARGGTILTLNAKTCKGSSVVKTDEELVAALCDIVAGKKANQ